MSLLGMKFKYVTRAAIRVIMGQQDCHEISFIRLSGKYLPVSGG